MTIGTGEQPQSPVAVALNRLHQLLAVVIVDRYSCVVGKATQRFPVTSHVRRGLAQIAFGQHRRSTHRVAR